MADRLERLLNLIIALRDSPRPLSAEAIHERVAGYRGRPDEAFRRMLERDKADLRGLGVPIETVPVDRWRDRHGYRIDPARYDLPPLDLDADALAALALAARAAGLDDDVRRGLRKLTVDVDVDAAARESGDPPVRVPLSEPRLAALETARARREPVAFRYRPPGRAGSVRTVDPWGLVHRSGRWYLVGRDHDRGERRTFRLDRVEGDVETVGPPGSYEPAEVTIDDVVPDGGGVTAELAAEADVAWRVARRAEAAGVPGAGGRTLFVVRSRSAEELVGWVVGLGRGVEVLGPPPLRTAVVTALERLAGQGGRR
ncbi:MAG: WYL domain-containing protein [Egibacteraceae bacterium]